MLVKGGQGRIKWSMGMNAIVQNGNKRNASSAVRSKENIGESLQIYNSGSVNVRLSGKCQSLM